MLTDFTAVATAMTRAVLNAGGTEDDLKNIQVTLPREVFDRLVRDAESSKGADLVKVDAHLHQANDSMRIYGINFVRSPL
jgi:hypothetical protein